MLIDEWQLVPAVWDRVRRAVDEDRAAGRFLLTGSAGVGAGVRIDSGAGRIVTLTLRPLSFAERGLHEPSVSLQGLLHGAADIRGESEVDLRTYAEEILRSGFPGIRGLAGRARDVQLDGYLARVVDRELAEAGVEVRRPAALRAWLSAYAAATATTTDYAKSLSAATPAEGEEPVRQTAAAYREHLTRLFLLDPVQAWTPAFNPLKRLAASPKHHLVDPALAPRLVGVRIDGLLRGDGQRVGAGSGTWLGALFESLATQAVRVHATAAGARVGHLRTRGGEHEVNLIVERGEHSVVAVEVKLGPAQRPGRPSPERAGAGARLPADRPRDHQHPHVCLPAAGWCRDRAAGVTWTVSASA